MSSELGSIWPFYRSYPLDVPIWDNELYGYMQRAKVEDPTSQAVYTMTTPDKDRYGEIIEVAAWRDTAEQFLTGNNVFLLNHVSAPQGFLGDNFGHGDAIPIGEVKDLTFRKRGVDALVRYATDVADHPWARLIWDMVAKGYMKAVSPGFIPLDWEPLDSEADEMFGPFRFSEVDMLELSQATIPANRMAIRKMVELIRDKKVPEAPSLIRSLGLDGEWIRPPGTSRPGPRIMARPVRRPDVEVTRGGGIRILTGQDGKERDKWLSIPTREELLGLIYTRSVALDGDASLGRFPAAAVRTALDVVLAEGGNRIQHFRQQLALARGDAEVEERYRVRLREIVSASEESLRCLEASGVVEAVEAVAQGVREAIADEVIEVVNPPQAPESPGTGEAPATPETPPLPETVAEAEPEQDDGDQPIETGSRLDQVLSRIGV